MKTATRNRRTWKCNSFDLSSQTDHTQLESCSVQGSKWRQDLCHERLRNVFCTIDKICIV